MYLYDTLIIGVKTGTYMLMIATTVRFIT